MRAKGDVGEESRSAKKNRTLRNSKMILAYALKPNSTCSMRFGLATPRVIHADRREG